MDEIQSIAPTEFLYDIIVYVWSKMPPSGLIGVKDWYHAENFLEY